MESTIRDQENAGQSSAPKLSAWLWSPRYAKLWWAAIPLWWTGMAASTRIDALEPLYRGALAGYLNILFYPMTALMVLGVGYVWERLDRFVGSGDGAPLSDEEAAAQRLAWDEHERMMKNARAAFDPTDPRSGTLWIGNSLNPHNPAYIDPHTGKHR